MQIGIRNVVNITPKVAVSPSTSRVMRSKVQILDAVNQEIRVIYIRRRWSIGALLRLSSPTHSIDRLRQSTGNRPKGPVKP
uniref:Putative ovule protein n=1 Tax=Solanum chacoense TaxID=4108 RepID=A0A0V0GLM0_SOLCH